MLIQLCAINKWRLDLRHNPKLFLTCFSAISSNLLLSSLHIFAASTLAALSSLGSGRKTCRYTDHSCPVSSVDRVLGFHHSVLGLIPCFGMQDGYGRQVRQGDFSGVYDTHLGLPPSIKTAHFHQCCSYSQCTGTKYLYFVSHCASTICMHGHQTTSWTTKINSRSFPES